MKTEKSSMLPVVKAEAVVIMSVFNGVAEAGWDFARRESGHISFYLRRDPHRTNLWGHLLPGGPVGPSVKGVVKTLSEEATRGMKVCVALPNRKEEEYESVDDYLQRGPDLVVKKHQPNQNDPRPFTIVIERK